MLTSPSTLRSRTYRSAAKEILVRIAITAMVKIRTFPIFITPPRTYVSSDEQWSKPCAILFPDDLLEPEKIAFQCPQFTTFSVPFSRQMSLYGSDEWLVTSD